MASLDITKNYSDGSVLLEADLDAIQSSLTTFFNTTKINDDNIQTGGITANTKLVATSVNAAKIVDETIVSAKIADSAVTTGKLAASTVSTANLNDGAVTAGKIASTTIVSADFIDASITLAKRASLATATGSETVFASIGTSVAETDVTGCTVTITTTGRPVMLSIGGGATAVSHTTYAYLMSGKDSTTSHEAYFRVYRDATPIAVNVTYFGKSSAVNAYVHVPSTSLWFIDAPAAGTYTYKLTVDVTTATSTDTNWQLMKMQAWEL